jgi:hypothetical protein
MERYDTGPFEGPPIIKPPVLPEEIYSIHFTHTGVKTPAYRPERIFQRAETKMRTMRNHLRIVRVYVLG